MRLHFLGAAHTVTGSCFLLETGDRKILIDCGMFQGMKRLRQLNYEDFLFVPSEIDCVLLTHAHIDHCGLIPKLCKEGFKGTVYTTNATYELAKILLPDSAYIQENDAEIQNRKGQRSGLKPIQPIYQVKDAMDSLEHFSTLDYEQEFDVFGDGVVKVIFHDAGHILGSSFIEMEVTEEKKTKLIFSGDLGQPNQPILKDAQKISGADFLIVESTYGDRVHPMVDREEVLAEVINDTMDRGGNLIIPSFAVGRTQTLLYYLYKLWKAGKIDDVPIILDSPLAIQATRIFAKNAKDFDDESLEIIAKSGRLPQMPQLRMCESSEESRALNSSEGSAVIISASGMADAGRVLHHLKHNLWRPESTVLFVGYQAEGSMGRRLLDGIKRVRILGEEIAVNAKIQMIEGFSAHADVHQMLDWLAGAMNPKPAKIFIVHGEGSAQENLKAEILEQFGIESYIPFRGDTARIYGRASQIEPSTLPTVSVEKELEDVLRTFESEYRIIRKNLLRAALKQPSLLQPLTKTIAKSWNYMKKLFEAYLH